MKNKFDILLDGLGIEPGDTIFVHSSKRHMGYSESDAVELIRSLLRRLGASGVLLMPSYKWLGRESHPPEGSVFDVRNDPSKVGRITEIFRCMPDTYRSEQFWLPICGQGKRARDLLEDQAKIVAPYGEGSTFDRLLEFDTKIVGLGVSLNTNTFAHQHDYWLEQEYPIEIFSEKPLNGFVRTYNGNLIRVSSYYAKPEIMAQMKPSRIIEMSPAIQDTIRRCDEGTSIRFSYSLNTYLKEAYRIGKECLRLGKPLPWIGHGGGRAGG